MSRRCQEGVKDVSSWRCVLPCSARGVERLSQRYCMAGSKVLNDRPIGTERLFHRYCMAGSKILNGRPIGAGWLSHLCWMAMLLEEDGGWGVFL